MIVDTMIIIPTKVRRLKRKFAPDCVYHVYNRGNRQMNIFHYPSDFKFFRKKLRCVAHSYSIEIICFCLMPTHYHLLLRQGHLQSISKLMQRLQLSYSCRYNSRYKEVGRMFQGRFRSRLVQQGTDFLNMIEYIRNNPVRSGLVKYPSDYAWLDINYKYEELLLSPDLPRTRSAN